MSGEGFPGLRVIIVNWCNPEDTIECIQSVLSSSISHSQVLVIDNGSNDDSINQISIAFPDVEILSLQENLGYAGGYNFGIESALRQGANEVFILNNDTIVDPQAISLLITSSWDIRVPKIYFHEPADLIWSAGSQWRKFPPMVTMRGYRKPDNTHYSNPLELEFATGCALMIKREVFERAGLFDLEFKNYFEDYDFIYRVRKAGFRVGFVPEAKIWHKVSRSLGEGSPDKMWYLGKNSVLFYRKGNRFSSCSLLSYLIWVSLREMFKLNFDQIIDFWKGVRVGSEIINGNRSM